MESSGTLAAYYSKPGGMPDHVHLILSHKPTAVLSDVIRDIKAGSSRWVHEHIDGLTEFAWQSGFGLFTVGAANLDQVCTYVANQKEHHKAITYEGEFQAMLERAGVKFDTRYLLD